MTDTAADPYYDVVIVGAGAGGRCVGVKLLEVGVRNFVVLEKAPEASEIRAYGLESQLRFGHEVTSSVFDDDTDSWTVRTRVADTWHSRVVIAAPGPSHAPWFPDLAGRHDFRGVSFHSAEWNHHFDPAGKRIAVIGADPTGGFVPQLVESAASVEAFPHAPRRIAPEPYRRTSRARRRLLHWLRPTAETKATLVASDIDTLTASGIRTCDGLEHEADAIIYATGFALGDRVVDDTLVGARGLTIQQAWRDGAEPYRGVAIHGFPNYFLITGPDFEAQASYVLECLALMKRSRSTRMEVRRSSQQLFNERVHIGRRIRQPPSSAFDLTSDAGVEDEIYDGAATLTLVDIPHQVRVRLTGHLDPIDGRYHWQGVVFDPLPADSLKAAKAVTLTVDGRTAKARIAEQTPWGSHSVVGVGAPPFALDDVVNTVRQT